MYSLMMSLLGSKCVGMMKKGLVVNVSLLLLHVLVFILVF